MKSSVYQLFILMLLISCSESKTPDIETAETGENSIEGTWKLVYADIRENDSLQVKDLSKTDFIKIINKTHFAFFNQEQGTSENFVAGAGTYKYDGEDYIETLDFIPAVDYRKHIFPFKLEIKGDSLIQHGHEKIESANLDRFILEKYIRIVKSK